MWFFDIRVNATLILAYGLFLYGPALADRFNNTGYGTINTCDTITRIGIGVISPDSMPSQSNLVLGMIDTVPSDGYYGAQLQLNAPHNDSGLAAFIENYMEDGHSPVLRFLKGSNLSGSAGVVGEFKLSSGDFIVSGGLYATSITINATDPPDYVFEPGYKLRSLEETEKFIRLHRHLPDIPSANELGKGMNLADMNLQLLKQIEELNLRAINQEKRIKNLEKKLLKQGAKP